MCVFLVVAQGDIIMSFCYCHETPKYNDFDNIYDKLTSSIILNWNPIPQKVGEILPILINRKVDLGEICIMKPTCRWDFGNKSQKFYKQL